MLPNTKILPNRKKQRELPDIEWYYLPRAEDPRFKVETPKPDGEKNYHNLILEYGESMVNGTGHRLLKHREPKPDDTLDLLSQMVDGVITTQPITEVSDRYAKFDEAKRLKEIEEMAARNRRIEEERVVRSKAYQEVYKNMPDSEKFKEITDLNKIVI